MRGGSLWVGLVAFALAVGAGVSLRGERGEAGTPIPANRVFRVVAPAPESCVRAAALQAHRDSLQRDLAMARATLQQLRDENREGDGVPLEWPADVDPFLTEVGVMRALERSLEIDDGEVLSLDCSEYPCMAVVFWGPREAEGMAHRRFRDDLRAQGYRTWGQPGWSRKRGTEWYTVGFPGEDLDWSGVDREDPVAWARVEPILQRRKFRYRELKDAVSDELDERNAAARSR